MAGKKRKHDLNFNDAEDFRHKKELVINGDDDREEQSQTATGIIIKSEKGIPTKKKFNPSVKPSTSGHNVNSDPSLVDDDDESHIEPDDNINLRVSSKQISEFCQSLIKMGQDGKIRFTDRKASTSLESLLRGTELASINTKEYQTALRYYCRLACRLSSLSFENMLLVVLEFAQDGKNVAQHPCYPKVPVSVYVRFCRKNGYNLLEKMPPALLEQYHKKDNPVVKKLEQEFFDDRHDFCERLREFLSEYSETFTTSQIEFVEGKIKQIEKQEKADLKRKMNESKPKIIQVAKPKSEPFDYFKISKKDKYLDLAEDEREAKLRRKYDKLNPAMREIYETLAKNITQQLIQ